LLCIPVLCHTHHIPSPSHSCSSALCDNFHSPVTFSLLDPNISLNTLLSNTLSLYFSP
jgi:hypothetical protein